MIRSSEVENGLYVQIFFVTSKKPNFGFAEFLTYIFKSAGLPEVLKNSDRAEQQFDRLTRIDSIVPLWSYLRPVETRYQSPTGSTPATPVKSLDGISAGNPRSEEGSSRSTRGVLPSNRLLRQQGRFLVVRHATVN